MTVPGSFLFKSTFCRLGAGRWRAWPATSGRKSARPSHPFSLPARWRPWWSSFARRARGLSRSLGSTPRPTSSLSWKMCSGSSAWTRSRRARSGLTRSRSRPQVKAFWHTCRRSQQLMEWARLLQIIGKFSIFASTLLLVAADRC